MSLNQRLENLTIDKDSILYFDEGILGFENVKQYVLLQEEDVPFLMTLQAVESEHPSFVVVDPFAVVEEYAPRLSQSDMHFFNGAASEDLRFLVMVVMPSQVQDAVVNLKSPLVIDVRNNHCRQVILEDNAYPIRHRLFGDNH